MMKLPKKRKANLNHFGLGNASQKYRQNIVNSQASIMHESDLNLDEFKNKNGPKRKRRKLDVSQIDMEEDGDENDDNGQSNAVIDSLLGFNLSASDGDGDDIDMGNMAKNKNRNSN